jgi:AbrB family looped-hinge helix DNA binding protein
MAVAAKTRSHMSSKGQVVIPKSLRDSKGIGAGSEIEFVDHPEGVLMRLPQRKKKYTLEDLLNVLPPYKGPPVTDEMMQDGIDAAMQERWDRKERNSRS